MNRRKTLPLLLLIPVLLLIALLALTPKPAPRPTVRLTNGTTISLEDVTYGKTHLFVFGKPYQKSLYRILPAKFKGLSGAIVNNCTTANTNDPVFWLTFKSEKPLQYSAITVLDEYGSELSPNGSSMGTSARHQGGSTPIHIVHYQLDMLAPHGKIVGICFYSDQSKTQKLAQLIIPGTSLVSMPTTNSSLPVAKSAGELNVKLIGLISGLKAVPDYFNRATNQFYTQARFRITNKSGSVRGWTAESIKIVGNDGKASRIAKCDGFIGDDFIVNFDRDLAPAVPCKFEIQFSKYAGFSNDQKTTLKAVPFPANGEVNSLNLSTNLHERTLTIKSIHAANSPGSNYPFQKNQPVIEVSVAPVSSRDNLLLIDALDEQGAKMSRAGYSQKGKGGYLFGFQNNVTAKTVDLTFGLNRDLSFEFEATPVRFQSTNSVPVK